MYPHNSSNSENQMNDPSFIQWSRNNPQFPNLNNNNPYTHNLINSSPAAPSSHNLNHFPQNSPNINNAYPYFPQNSLVQPQQWSQNQPQQWSQNQPQNQPQWNESYPLFSSQIPSCNSNATGSGFEEDNIDEEDTEVGDETPKSGRNPKAFEFKEDEALISSFMRISSDSCIGTNQKMSSFWSKVKALYDEARAANGTQMKVDRTQSMLVGRWGRITKAVMKFVGCIEAAKRDLGNRTSGMNDDDIIQRARGIYQGKFTFEAQWKMLRKFPKWQEVVTEYNSRDRRSTQPRQGRRSDQATPTTPSDDSGKRTRLNEVGGFSTPSDDGEGSRGRPMGRNEAKRKKGKGVVSSSVGIPEELSDSISIYRDVQLKKLEAAQLKEARKQSQLDLEMRRLAVEEKEAKYQKKWNMYESLMRRPNLTQKQQELADKLFNEIQEHLD